MTDKIQYGFFFNHQPSMRLKSVITYIDKVSSLTFQGKGANENNYLQQKKIYAKKFKELEYYKYYLNLNEEDVLRLADSIFNKKMDFLKQYEELDADFRLYESFELNYKKAAFLERYKLWKGEFIKDKNFKVSDNFSDPLQNIDVNNEKLLAHPEFNNYIGSLIYWKRNNKTITDKTYAKLESIDTEITSQKIKDELAYIAMKFGINKTKRLDSVYQKYMSIVKNETYRNEITEIYQNFKKIVKGTVSPTFELYDINNKQVTLESLQGKLVYIDIWATWCVPCVKQIPALNKLEKEFKNKNITFVSICTSDTKERWKKMVEEKEMGGIQLFAPDGDISFFKDYYLKGIPRFIFIDEMGKIIDANAYKPSDPKLKELIEAYLKKD